MKAWSGFRFGFVAFLAITVLPGGSVFGMDDTTDRYQRGYNQLKALDSEAADRVLSSLESIAPDMAGFIVEFGYGDIYSRPGLDVKTRQIATIAALTALGNAEPQLKFHMGAALNVGVTPEEIIDTIYVTTVYAGFPAGLNAIFAAGEVFRERGVAIRPASSEASEASADRRTRGLKTLDATSKGAGRAVAESLANIAPDMAEFIIDFSYGDIFSRGILSEKHKELAGIAAMCAAGTMRPQLKVHVRAAMNVGYSREEIVEVLIQMAAYAGFPASLNGLFAAREVFDPNE